MSFLLTIKQLYFYSKIFILTSLLRVLIILFNITLSRIFSFNLINLYELIILFDQTLLNVKLLKVKKT